MTAETIGGDFQKIRALSERTDSMAFWAASKTFITSIPSTLSLGISYPRAFMAIEDTAEARSTAVPMPYRLFSQTHKTGRSQTLLIFNASWKNPILVAPSPNMQIVTLFRLPYLSPRAMPVAIGKCAPNNGVSAPEVFCGIGHMHRTALAVRCPGRLCRAVPP